MKLKRLPFVLRDQERDARLKLYGVQAAWRTRPLNNKARAK